MPLFEPYGLKLKNNNYFYLSNTVNLESCYLKLFPTWSKTEYFILFFLFHVFVHNWNAQGFWVSISNNCPYQCCVCFCPIYGQHQMHSIYCIFCIATAVLVQQYVENILYIAHAITIFKQNKYFLRSSIGEITILSVRLQLILVNGTTDIACIDINKFLGAISKWKQLNST